MSERSNPSHADPFDGFALEAAIRSRAARCSIDLPTTAVTALAVHGRAVLEHNDKLHLTTITDPVEFVERHLGESFEGAAMLDAGVNGRLLDLGSGNGYPGIAVAMARSGLHPVLAEASTRKADFLRRVVEDAFDNGEVLTRQVQRHADVADVGPIRVLASRAVGGWERIVPRLAPSLTLDGEVLLWAGPVVDAVRRRNVWSRLRLEERREIPGRERSWVWRFRVADAHPG